MDYITENLWNKYTQKLINGELRSIISQMEGRLFGDRTQLNFNDSSEKYTLKVSECLLEDLEYRILKEPISYKKDKALTKKLEILDASLMRMFEFARDYKQDWNGNKKDSFESKEKTLLLLGQTFVEAGRYNDIALVECFIDEGFPINFQDPKKSRTLLHTSAQYGANEIVEKLAENGDTNFLLRDFKGRLAYDVAYYHGFSIEMSELLKKKTLEQANVENKKPSDVFNYKL